MVAHTFSSTQIGSVLPMQKTNRQLTVCVTLGKPLLLLNRQWQQWKFLICIICFTFCFIVPLVFADASSKDKVYFVDKDTTRHIKGTIKEFDGEGLRIISTNGQERLIEAESVLRIDTQRLPGQRAARLAAKAGQYSKAAGTYYRILQTGAEKRNWIRREILSELVLTLRADGKEYQASKIFLQLLRDDPRTPYFDVIPLVWTGGTILSPEAEIAAAKWMKSEIPAERLLGSSLLLGSRKSQQAESVLKTLAETAVRPIDSIAKVQGLRLGLHQVTEKNIQTCKQSIKQIPLSLRGGPYYILGRLYFSQKKYREAAVASMRVPILYSDNPILAAESLLIAGRAMSRSGLIKDAEHIYNELINTYPKTTAAADAKQREAALKELP